MKCLLLLVYNQIYQSIHVKQNSQSINIKKGSFESNNSTAGIQRHNVSPTYVGLV